MTGPGDWVIPGQNVSAPPFIGPNDGGIILGPDVPPCMAATYTAVWRFQPPGAATGGLNAPPSLYFGQTGNPGANNEIVDVGYLVYDGATVCGFVVFMRYTSQNRVDGTGSQWMTTQFGGFNSGTLPTFRNEFFFGDTSGAPPAFIQPVHIGINKGDPLARQPNPRNTQFTIDSVSAARGLLGRAESAADTAAIGAEAVVLTGPTRVFYDTRAFEVIVHEPALTGSAVAIAAIRSIRRTNLAGAILVNQLANQLNTTVAGISTALTERMIIKNNSGADITDNLVLTLAASAGTIVDSAAANRIRYLEYRDVGAAADYPLATQI